MIFELFVASVATISVAFGTSCSDPSNSIQTEPILIKNTLARNFNGLKLSIKLVLIDGLYSWTHPGLPQREISIYNPVAGCANRTENGFQVTCKEVLCEGSSYIINSLTLMFPLNKEVAFAVSMTQIAFISSILRLASIDIMVKDCRVFSGRSLEVVSQSSDYNASGEFRCRNNGILFYSNKTRVVSNKTKCLATAQWEDSDVVQCWTAPSNVSVVGNLDVTEGSDINLKCQHLSGFPASNGSLFFFNGETYVEENGIFTITNVQKANHKQSVSCEVQSPYVALVDQLYGRSQQRFINVLYRPFAASPQQCSWVVNTTGMCKIYFQSNSNPQFRSVVFNGADVTDLNIACGIVRSSTTQQYFYFIREEVNQTFTGLYELILYSNGIGETKIPFQISVVDQMPMTLPPASYRLTLIVNLSIGIAFSVIFIVMTTVFWRDKYCLKK